MEKYKTTKTIRFKLEPILATQIISEAKKLEREPTENMLSLITGGFEIIPLLEQFVFNGELKKRLKTNVTIHYRWLRQYTKYLFYNWKAQQDKKPEKKIRFLDVPYLKDVLDAFIEEWMITIGHLNTAKNKPDESKTRKADIALHVKKLGIRQMSPFLKNFIESVNDKKSEGLKTQLAGLIEKFQTNLLVCEKHFLPAQSSGIVLTRASFNYYTINKKPKDFDKEITDIQAKLTGRFDLQNSEKQLLALLQIDHFVNSSIEKLYEQLKDYKAKQKSVFMEAVNKELKYDELKEKFTLFKTDENTFIDFSEKTKQITEKSTHKSKLSKKSEETQGLQKEIDKAKRERGRFFQEKFNAYVNLCDLYKKVAVKKGQLQAQLKSIEKERVDSQRLQYWAIILEKDGKHQLALIPKHRVGDAYKKIKSQKPAPSGEQDIIYYFESMTYRALRKLCFGMNGNTFLPEIQKELPKYNLKDFGEFRFKKDNDDPDEAGLVKFYQKVLQTNFVKENLALPQGIFGEVSQQHFVSLNDFKITLEKVCYVRSKIVHNDFVDNLIKENNTQIFMITSLDLEKREKKRFKAHTRLWLDFWNEQNEKDNFNLRLNPEISIAWREAKKSRIEKYGEDTALYGTSKKNRYLYPQFTIITTFTENALSNEISYAFEDVKKKGETIIEFNKKINNKLKKELNENNLWFYGIDVGEIELATLCLMDKDKKPFRFPVIELKKDKLNFSKKGYVYKNGESVQREKPYLALSNLSYFLNRDLFDKTFRGENFGSIFKKLFEEKEVSVIDLTTAKLINEKIVLNGDLITFLNLKILHAKRKIYQELIQNPGIKLNVIKEAANSRDSYKIKLGDKIIYHSRKDFECLKSFDAIADELSRYFRNQQKDEAKVEDNINNTRRAIVGNMTGVIFHLYKQHHGIISIENLQASKVESDRKKFEGNVERPLEWALYRKFQSLGLTPPISELIALREVEKFSVQNTEQLRYESIKQFGIINFVSPENTSKICPNCDKNAYGSDNKEVYKENKEKQIFYCNHCKFHNKNNPMGLDVLNTNDKIAAYNIAKKGFEELQKRN